MRALLSRALACACLLLAVGPARAEDAAVARLWDALRQGGHAALMRHATAPGVGDPEGMRLDDCATQRNLSKRGRDEARAIGAAFRDKKIAVTRVLTSRWCRARETAELLDLGPVEPFRALDSFFEARTREAEQTAAVRRALDAAREGASIVLVTHQVNITALTGIFPASGEIVVLRPAEGDSFTVLGRIPPP